MAKIVLASPARAGARSGNGATAARWRRLWTELGHDVRVTTTARVEDAALLVALHATKCADAIDRFHAQYPDRPLVVGVSGTDIHGKQQRRFLTSLELADAIVVLQPRARDALPEHLRERTTTILQSVETIARRPARTDVFEIAVVAGLRAVKDPLRAALAVRTLPASSRIVVTHYGPALDETLADRARAYSRDRRYEWHGSQSRTRTHELLARAQALCITSKSEGGANVVSEAIAAGCPILASAIPGNQGLLGEDWPAQFAVGSTRALRDLMLRFEQDERFQRTLERRVIKLRARFAPNVERAAWHALLSRWT